MHSRPFEACNCYTHGTIGGGLRILLRCALSMYADYQTAVGALVAHFPQDKDAVMLDLRKLAVMDDNRGCLVYSAGLGARMDAVNVQWTGTSEKAGLLQKL